MSERDRQTWHPTPQQALLIRIALAKDVQTASSLWEEWHTHYEVVDVHDETYLLLASAIATLLRHNVSLSAKLVGVARNTALRSALINAGLRDVVATLAPFDIPVYPLKGIALYARGVYTHTNERAMYDLDLYVPRSSHAQALAALTDAGWHVRKDIENDHSVTLTRPGISCTLDLHRRPWGFYLNEETRRGFERDALAMTYNGVAVRIIRPELLLVHVLVHGARSGDNEYSAVLEPHARWIIDACKLLAHEQSFDWHHFVNWVQRLEVGLQVKEALLLLEENFEEPVPGSVLKTLARSPHTRTQRLHKHYSMDYRTPHLFKGIRSVRHIFDAWLLRRHEPAYINTLTLRTYIRAWYAFFGEMLAPNGTSVVIAVVRKVLAEPWRLLP